MNEDEYDSGFQDTIRLISAEQNEFGLEMEKEGENEKDTGAAIDAGNGAEGAPKELAETPAGTAAIPRCRSAVKSEPGYDAFTMGLMS